MVHDPHSYQQRLGGTPPHCGRQAAAQPSPLQALPHYDYDPEPVLATNAVYYARVLRRRKVHHCRFAPGLSCGNRFSATTSPTGGFGSPYRT